MSRSIAVIMHENVVCFIQNMKWYRRILTHMLKTEFCMSTSFLPCSLLLHNLHFTPQYFQFIKLKLKFTTHRHHNIDFVYVIDINFWVLLSANAILINNMLVHLMFATQLIFQLYQHSWKNHSSDSKIVSIELDKC